MNVIASSIATNTLLFSGASGIDALLGGRKSAKTDSFASLLAMAGAPKASKSAQVSAINPLSLSTFDSIIGTSGPLPAFLEMVVKTRGLDDQKAYALYAITARNMNIEKTPEAIHKLARELDAAGI